MRAHLSALAAAWRLALVLSAVSCASCSGDSALHAVHGKVLYENQPIQGVVVSFHPAGADNGTTLLPVGQTKEDGSFTLTTGKSNGAPAGHYFVTFTCPKSAGPPEGEKEPQEEKKMMIPKRKPGFDLVDKFKGTYNQATSEFKAEIKKGNNELEPFSLPSVDGK